ncbi:MAG: hypothetical protein LH467_06670 [Gemmatimonadaceae bacterium]|nr:hypothetical protein [Gemmatimonadaceae bacterium]
MTKRNGSYRALWRVAILALTIANACRESTGIGSDAPPVSTMRPQTLVLFATPKFLLDFDNPEADVDKFLRHYGSLTSRAAETIVIFAVGNSDHMLTYRGSAFWADSVEWARWTDFKPVSDRTLTYIQIAAIVRTLKERAATLGIKLKVFDQIDPGKEFNPERFKYERHPECVDRRWDSFDIRARLTGDDLIYASAPDGIVEGTLCGTFIVDQASRYLHDLGFDGIMYGNQFGTRGRWLPDNGPGYSAEEATAILNFLDHSRRTYGGKEMIWFDSYNKVQVERETFSFPEAGYTYFDYVLAAGFCVITFPERYIENLESKLQLTHRPRILATLDYVDPWYSYNSMTDYPEESARLEQIAIKYRDRIDGIVFFANDDDGTLVPRQSIESFAMRFFGVR